MMSNFELLQRLIADIFDCEVEDITRDTDFIEDLYADSLDAMELAIMLEEELGLKKLTTADFSQYATVGDVADFLDGATSKGK